MTDASGQPGQEFGALGTWWRFERYELRDGYVRPAPGAVLQAYDPWVAYWEARSIRGGGAGLSPYESLLELAWAGRLLATGIGEEVVLEPASERAVLEWCGRWGLLGVLSHETELATLAPRWIRRPEDRAARRGPVPMLPAYAWGPGGWEPTDEPLRDRFDPVLEGIQAKEGALVPEELWPDDSASPHALRRLLGEGTWDMSPLGEAWGPYFPDVAEADRDTYPYPLPLSEAFWAAYAEPAVAILSVGAFLLDTLRQLNPAFEGDEQLLDIAVRTTRGDQGLYSLLAGVQPAVGELTPDRRYRRAWRTKSLLASFAMMAYLELTDDKRILACEEDGRPFVSGAYQARYCSERCRRRALKRAYRHRLRERATRYQTSPRQQESNDGDEEGPE